MHPRLLAVVLALTMSCPVALGQETLAKSQTEAAVCQATEHALIVTIGDQPFLTYHKSIVQPPEGIDSVYQRSGYIHPIHTPTGREVTGDFAPDHAHQHAFFMAWVNTQFAGHAVDFWNQKRKTGRVSHMNVVSIENADSHCEFEVELIHEDITLPNQPVKVLSERWRIRVYERAVGEPFVFDFESNQTCVADTPLILKKHLYGGFGLRGNELWNKPNAKAAYQEWTKEFEKAHKNPNLETPDPPGFDVMGHVFLTSENKQRHDGNHTRARWTTLSGTVDDAIAGVAILSHPKNFRSPQHVRLHPNEPYFSYAPVVGGKFLIQPKEVYTTRFRVVSFDGQPNSDLLNQLWDDYAANESKE